MELELFHWILMQVLILNKSTIKSRLHRKQQSPNQRSAKLCVSNHRGDKDSMIVCLRDSSLYPRQSADNGVYSTVCLLFPSNGCLIDDGPTAGRSIR